MIPSQKAGDRPKKRSNLVDLHKLDLQVERLTKALRPVPDNGWLKHMSPSQALLCCLGSGPWRIERRTLIEQGALDLLGSRDITECSSELQNYFPLAWQKDYLQKIVIFYKDHLQQPFNDSYSESPRDTLANLEQAIDKNIYDFPKVLCMYVRDYLKLPIVPRDRHVNAKLDSFSIPKNTQIITEALIRVVTEDLVNSYARAMFEEKSTNPHLRVAYSFFS